MAIGLSTVNTGEGTGSGGSVKQYVVGSTDMGVTSTGIVFVGIQSTTARALALTATGGINHIATISTLLGTVAVSGGGGGVQYGAGATDMGATGTGTIPIGIQSGATTGRAFLVTTTGAQVVFIDTGTVTALPSGTQDVSVVNTPVITATISNNPLTITGTVTNQIVTYVNAATLIGATGTGILFVGVQSGATTSRAIMVTTTGAQHGFVVNTITITGSASMSGTGNVTVAGTPTVTATVSNNPLVCTAANVTIASVTTGTMSLSPMYINAQTVVGATGTGILFLGVQSGATTSRAIMVTTTGAQQAFVVNVISASGVTVASITTGTVNVATGLVTISSGGLGTVATVSTVSTLLGTVLVSGTVNAYYVSNSTRWQANVVATTSAATGVIVKTSGAHTLYITDFIVSVTGPTNVQLCSETTAFAQFYFATQGGAVMDLQQPISCTSAQSFRVILSSSGACGVTAVGYTVT